jgi:hypothetical protein
MDISTCSNLDQPQYDVMPDVRGITRVVALFTFLAKCNNDFRLRSNLLLQAVANSDLIIAFPQMCCNISIVCVK